MSRDFPTRRATQVLRLISLNEQQATIASLAESLDINLSTVQHCIDALIDSGWVMRRSLNGKVGKASKGYVFETTPIGKSLASLAAELSIGDLS